MPTISLSSVGTDNVNTASATPVNNNFTAIQNAVNALDNQNIAAGAAIVYSKLSLSGSIVNADIAPAAAIAASKLAAYPSDGTKGLLGDGTWGTPWTTGTAVGTQLDYAQITASPAVVTATTEGTAVAQITGASVAYDGTKVKIEFFAPDQVPNATTTAFPTFVFLRDSTVLGSYGRAAGSQNFGVVGPITFFDTPSAANHVYKVSMFKPGAGTSVQIKAGLGGTTADPPAWLRVTKA